MFKFKGKIFKQAGAFYVSNEDRALVGRVTGGSVASRLRGLGFGAWSRRIPGDPEVSEVLVLFDEGTRSDIKAILSPREKARLRYEL